MRPIIRVENLSKKFRIGTGQSDYGTVRDAFGRALRTPLNWFRRERDSEENTIWALKDVSFEVMPGEVLGIIGRNGAGKSTLLKILSRITDPTTGQVDLYGRVGSLLEVGTGFHPELTGRENVYLNGAILGMRHSEIDRKFDQIVDFSEITKFIDTPVKFYSSGMYMRLAFAVAAHLEPEILIVDEVLSVGDISFQKKCLGKMQEVGKEGRTVLFVSHNMGAVLNLCDRVIVMKNGQVHYTGSTNDGVSLYYQNNSISYDEEVDLSAHPARDIGSLPILRAVSLLDKSGISKGRFITGEKMIVEFTVDPPMSIPRPQFGIGVQDNQGTRIFAVATYLSSSVLPAITGPCKIRCSINELILAPGRYTMSLSAGNNDNMLIDNIEDAISFEVDRGNYFGNGSNVDSGLGKILMRSVWEKN
jgi:lipopolysaccharide transport system ATP-binding protein